MKANELDLMYIDTYKINTRREVVEQQFLK